MLVHISDMAWIPLKDYPQHKIGLLKEKLTIQPKKTSIHQDVIEPIELYRMKTFDADKKTKRECIGVPRAFFLQNRKEVHELLWDLSAGLDSKIEFCGTLEGDQGEAVNAVVSGLTTKPGIGGIVRASPGWGKTVVALKIISELGRNCIVVVHKEFLLDQWSERIKKFIPSARIGAIQGDRCEFGKDFDISIAMIQSLAARDKEYPDEFWSGFGTIVFDEIHRVSAPVWSRIAPKFSSVYRIGLTATPYRKDGTQDVFFWNIGPISYVSNVRKVVPRLRRIFTEFSFVRTPTFDPSRLSKEIQLRFICKSPERNKLIVSELLKAINAGRKVIVLSERLKHLDILKEMFVPVKPADCVVDFYVGGRTREELKKAEDASVLFCTYQMTKEALDIPALDTVFLATPVADVEQAVGRIMRECDEKKEPIITDFIDKNIPSLVKLWGSRKRFYLKSGMFKEQCDGQEQKESKQAELFGQNGQA